MNLKLLVLEMILVFEIIVQLKCIANDLIIKMYWEKNHCKMHFKWFYYRNVLEIISLMCIKRILQWKFSQNVFAIKMH